MPTKGKWTADDYGGYVFAHEEEMMICRIRGWAYLKAQGLSDDEAIEVQKANARLIAAAPEMFKELGHVLTYLYMVYGTEENIPSKFLVKDDIKRIEALLASIDGKDDNHE